MNDCMEEWSVHREETPAVSRTDPSAATLMRMEMAEVYGPQCDGFRHWSTPTGGALVGHPPEGTTGCCGHDTSRYSDSDPSE